VRNSPTRIRVSDIPRFESSENRNKIRPGSDVISNDNNSRLGLPNYQSCDLGADWSEEHSRSRSSFQWGPGATGFWATSMPMPGGLSAGLAGLDSSPALRSGLIKTRPMVVPRPRRFDGDAGAGGGPPGVKLGVGRRNTSIAFFHCQRGSGAAKLRSRSVV
jgi:hypothetical protein